MTDPINDPEVLAEVATLLARYEAALMANDIAELDALFWRSEHARRFGVGECLYGRAIAFGRARFARSRRSTRTAFVHVGWRCLVVRIAAR